MRLGLQLHGQRLSDIAAYARWAEESGFSSIWVGEGRLSRDAIVPMTLAAANTDRIAIGSAVIPFRTRNVALIGVTFKTLNDVAPGRIRLGLGAWWEPIASRTGLHSQKPGTAMREVVSVLKGLFAGSSVTFQGEYVDVDSIKFDAEDDDQGAICPVPIYIGAVRERMLQLAGEIADGVVMDYQAPPDRNVEYLRHIELGALRVGRSLEDIDRPQLILCCVDDDDPSSAVETCKAFVTQSIAQQPHIGEHCGLDPELVDAIRSELPWPATTSQVRHTMRLVPTQLVRSITACGTSSEAMSKIEDYIQTGCTEAVLTPCDSGQRTVAAIAQKASGKLQSDVQSARSRRGRK
jgi:5,10-methylenetetrahydromethanopterin reductase